MSTAVLPFFVFNDSSIDTTIYDTTALATQFGEFGCPIEYIHPTHTLPNAAQKWVSYVVAV
jgi:hypothetical protein